MKAARDLADPVADNGGEQMGARDVHVCEIGAVRLVHVEVNLHNGRMRARDYGLEQGFRWHGRRLDVDLVPVRLEEAYLSARRQFWWFSDAPPTSQAIGGANTYMPHKRQGF